MLHGFRRFRLRPSPAARRNGFVLLEILVGLAILAVTASFAFQSLSGSFRWLDRGARDTTALLVAQSLLDAASVAPAGGAGRAEGLDWRVEAIAADGVIRLTVQAGALSLPAIVP